MAHKLPWDLNAGMYVIGACIGIASGLWSVEKLPLYSPPILCILWFVAVCVPVGLFWKMTVEWTVRWLAYGWDEPNPVSISPELKLLRRLFSRLLA